MPHVPHFGSPHELPWASILIASPFPSPLFNDRLKQAADLYRVESASAIAEEWLVMGERDRAR
jgi:hypothetical protein